MEEERARQEAAAKKAAEETLKQEKRGEQPSCSHDATMTERATAATSEAENKATDITDNENALLQQALAMSMDDPASSHDARDIDMSDAVSDDLELALALQLSMQDSAKDSSNQTDMSNLLANQYFISSILASLPGVDPNDPSVKDLLASMQSQSEDCGYYVMQFMRDITTTHFLSKTEKVFPAKLYSQGEIDVVRHEFAMHF